MKDSLPALLLGFLLGLLAAAALALLALPRLMLNERPVALSPDAAAEKLSAAATANGWVVSSIMKLDESIAKHGGKPVPPVRLVKLCQPHHASAILSDPASRRVSVLMPCTIALYEGPDGKTRAATMNAGLMGRLFGGVISEVMSGSVAAEQEKILSALD